MNAFSVERSEFHSFPRKSWANWQKGKNRLQPSLDAATLGYLLKSSLMPIWDNYLLSASQAMLCPPQVAGTLQYAGQHLQTPLFVVLGHEQCGAVQAALDVKFRGGKEKDRIQLLLANILPGLEGIDEHSTPENLTSLAVEANVRWSMRQILESPEGRTRVAENRYKLVGAVYEISSGRVRFL